MAESEAEKDARFLRLAGEHMSPPWTPPPGRPAATVTRILFRWLAAFVLMLAFAWTLDLVFGKWLGPCGP